MRTVKLACGPAAMMSNHSLIRKRPQNHRAMGTRDTAASRVYGGMSLYTCMIRVVELEANVVCNDAACRAQRVRRAVLSQPIYSNHSGRPSRPLQDTYTHRYFFQEFSNHWRDDRRICIPPYRQLHIWQYEHVWIPIILLLFKPSGTQLERHIRRACLTASNGGLNGYSEASRWMESTPRTYLFALLSINKTTGEPYGDLLLNHTMATITHTSPIYMTSLP